MSILQNTMEVMIHETIILPIVLYGCEMWALSMM